MALPCFAIVQGMTKPQADALRQEIREAYEVPSGIIPEGTSSFAGTSVAVRMNHPFACSS